MPDEIKWPLPKFYFSVQLGDDKGRMRGRRKTPDKVAVEALLGMLSGKQCSNFPKGFSAELRLAGFKIRTTGSSSALAVCSW